MSSFASSNDLKRFKRVTSGHHVIMGRKTYESLGKPLPNRTNLIVTRNPEFEAKGCQVFNTLEAAIEQFKHDDIYILGGAEVYAQAIEFAHVLDVTLVEASLEADTFFPEIDPEIWQETFREDHRADSVHRYNYSFVSYKRRL
jgi:dihydrofolate reductase